MELILPHGNSKIIDLADEDIAELDAINKTCHFRSCPPWTGWGGPGFLKQSITAYETLAIHSTDKTHERIDNAY